MCIRDRAKAIVDGAPKAVKEKVSKAEADDIKKKLEEAEMCIRDRVGTGHRTAGRHDALDVLGQQEGDVLPGVLPDGLRAAAAVGHPTRCV